MTKTKSQFATFFITLATATTLVLTLTSSAKAGQFNWNWGTGVANQFMSLEDHLNKSEPKLRENTYIYIVLGVLDPNYMGGVYSGQYLSVLANNLASGNFDPNNTPEILETYSGSTESGRNQNIKKDVLTPLEVEGTPGQPRTGLTFLVVTVDGDFGDPDCKYNYFFLTANTFIRSDNSSPSTVGFNASNPQWVVIPEPATGMLALAGLGLLLRRRRR